MQAGLILLGGRDGRGFLYVPILAGVALVMVFLVAVRSRANGAARLSSLTCDGRVTPPPAASAEGSARVGGSGANRTVLR